MNKLSFDEIRNIINDIPVPAQRLGIFNIKINNCHKRYYFKCLNVNAGSNPDLFGFGLNHYSWFPQLPKQNFKRSKFHNEEDVSIDISRIDFEYSYKVEGFNEIFISVKNSSIQINW